VYILSWHIITVILNFSLLIMILSDSADVDHVAPWGWKPFTLSSISDFLCPMQWHCWLRHGTACQHTWTLLGLHYLWLVQNIFRNNCYGRNKIWLIQTLKMCEFQNEFGGWCCVIYCIYQTGDALKVIRVVHFTTSIVSLCLMCNRRNDNDEH
jgi:hypothetical protein